MWLFLFLLLAREARAFSSTPTGAQKEGHLLLNGKHKHWYRVVRPEHLEESESGGPAPLLVCHGGPGVPSDYLFDLERVGSRPVIFWDQLGAGRSEAPSKDEDDGLYGVQQSVDALRALVTSLGLRRFHLLGQSWGGMLGYEYAVAYPKCKEGSGPRCLSLSLVNTPSSVPKVVEEAGKLVEACGGDPAEFERRHVCSVDPKPPLLVAAYAHAGTQWRGTDADGIRDWEVNEEEVRAVDIPSLYVRGEHDFVTSAAAAGWRKLGLGSCEDSSQGPAPSLREFVVPDAGHHCLLERPEEVLSVVAKFLAAHDGQ